MATQTSLAMAGARVAGIPPVSVPGLINLSDISIYLILSDKCSRAYQPARQEKGLHRRNQFHRSVGHFSFFVQICVQCLDKCSMTPKYV